GPYADAFDLSEAVDHLLVGKARQILESHGPVARMPRQVANVCCLLPGKSQRPHTRWTQSQDVFGGHLAARRRSQAAEDHACHAPAELLRNNRLHQGLEIRIPKPDTILADPFDDGRKHRVVSPKMMNSFLHMKQSCKGMRH